MIAPYDEYASICNGVINIFHGPLKYLRRYNFEAKNYAKDVKVSPIIFTSTGDKLIKKDATDRLIQYYDNIEEIRVFDEIGHNDYFMQPELFEKIHKYLQERL